MERGCLQIIGTLTSERGSHSTKHTQKNKQLYLKTRSKQKQTNKQTNKKQDKMKFEHGSPGKEEAEINALKISK